MDKYTQKLFLPYFDAGANNMDLVKVFCFTIPKIQAVHGPNPPWMSDITNPFAAFPVIS